MKSIKFLAIAFLVPSIFIFTSCMDSQIPEASDEALLTEIEEHINTPTVADVALDNAEAAVKAFTTNKSVNINGVQRVAAIYPIVTQISEGNNFPKVYEINYGDDLDNWYRGRIIHTVFSYKESKYEFNEFYRTETRYKYHVKGGDGYDIYKTKIEGFRKGDVNLKGVLNLSSDITITDIETKQSTRVRTNRVRTTIDNNNTETNYTDDSYEFTGYSAGTVLINGNLHDYNFWIDEPLIKVPNWKYFVSGKTTTIIGFLSNNELDFGNGELDNYAVRTIDGKPKDVVLNWGEKR